MCVEGYGARCGHGLGLEDFGTRDGARVHSLLACSLFANAPAVYLQTCHVSCYSCWIILDAEYYEPNITRLQPCLLVTSDRAAKSLDWIHSRLRLTGRSRGTSWGSPLQYARN